MRTLGFVLAAALTSSGSVRAAEYCIDQATGSDAASGLVPTCWATFEPSRTFALANGDTVHVRAGHYVYPTTAWYMLPGVSWIGAGAGVTTVEFDKRSTVPFVRFRTGSAGSGPVRDLRPENFGPDTVLAGLRLLNTRDATVGVDVAVTSADSSPTLRDLIVEGFPVGIQLHPSSDERASASTHALLSNNVIRSSLTAGFSLFADVFYPRTVTEASTVVNTASASSGTGAIVKTLVQDLRDWPDAVAEPVLTNVTMVGDSGSALLLAAYYNDGFGDALSTGQAGVTRPTVLNAILGASDRYGVEETSPFTEPAALELSCLGGNRLGDYLDEGATVLAAGAVGVANIGAPPAFVDLAAGDLHQLASSPTIDAADTVRAPIDDFDGHSRPLQGNADMGADEYFPCTAVADSSATRPGPPCTGRLTTLDAGRSTMDAACLPGPRYEWFDEADTLVGTGITLDVAPAAPTSYRLRVTCADPALSACFDDDTVLVDAAPDPPLVDAGLDRRGCGSLGEPVTFDLSATILLDPRATLDGVLWESGEGSFDDATAMNPVLTLTPAVLPTTVAVTVTATDCNGGVGVDDLLISVFPTPVPVIADPGLTCHDPDTVEVVVELVGSSTGGTGTVTQAWSSSMGTVIGQEAATLTLATSGDRQDVVVTLEVTDEEGCVGTVARTVSVSPGTVANAGPDRDECLAAGSASVTLDGSATRALAGATYAWSSDLGTVADASLPTASLELTLADATVVATVTLEVTSANGDCASIDQATLTLRPVPVARPGGPYSQVRTMTATTEIPLDGLASSGEGALAFAWTTDLGTFVDTGTTSSTLPAPELSIVNQDAVQRGRVCLTVTSENGCVSPQVCTDVALLLEPVDPPNDVGWTLRVDARPPADVRLRWTDAAVDASHDAADRYEVWSSERACGPFAVRATADRIPGENVALDPVLRSPPPIRFYAIVSVNDGGASDDPAPDGSNCP